jgi:integrase/recombinase XerD
MSQKPVSELRRRMLEDMAVRKFSETTCRNYIRHTAEFAKFLGRSPDTATADEVRGFQVHMTENGARPSTLNIATSALRSSLARPWIGLSWPGIWPACTTQDRYRGCFHRNR